MGLVKTYSFADLNLIFEHPSFPPFALQGSGIVDFKIDPGGKVGAIDIAADGAAMISKMQAPHRHFSITVQQVCPLHDWLNGLYNFLVPAPSALWALMNIGVSSVTGAFIKSTLSNCFFDETAGIPFAAQGQNVTWNLTCANGNNVGSVISAITGVQAQVITNTI